MNIFKKLKLLPNALLGYERSDPYRNGEFNFIKSFIKKGMTIFDVGANIGDHTKYMLKINPDIKVYCFEPVLKTYKVLENNLLNEIKKGKVIINNFGLSNEIKEAEIFIYEDLSGNNSLYFYEGYNVNINTVNREKIILSTINKYAEKNNIISIDFLKIDVEGNETKVIKGASELIEKRAIKCIQFEYNATWTASESKLENIFNYLSKYGFKFYRLTIWGKIHVKYFNKKLVNYKHSNYVAILNED